MWGIWRYFVALIEAQFLVPELQLDTRRLHHHKAISKLESDLVEMFGGFTVIEKVRGGWRNPETQEIIHDVSFFYIVATNRSGIKKLKEYIRIEVKKTFRQKAIYFKVGEKVEIL